MDNPAPSSEQPSAKWHLFTAVHMGERVLAWTTRLLTAARYEAVESWIERAGHYGLIVAAGLGLFCGIAGALKWDALSPFLIGAVWLPFVGVAQFTAYKVMPAAKDMIRSAGSALSLQAMLACIALWSLLLGAIMLLGFTFGAIRLDSFSLFGIGIGLFLAYELVLWLCLNPALLNIDLRPASSIGGEALGIIAFKMKLNLRLVPILFGVGVMVGDFGLLACVINLFRGGMDSMAGLWPSALLVVGAAMLPLIGYVFFALGQLMLELARATLSLPGKLDALAGKQGPKNDA